MALLPSVVLPLTLSRTTAPTSSPLSVRRPRPRALSIPRVHCCATRNPQSLAAARDAAASLVGKLAGAVPWKAAVSAVLAVAVSFTCLVGLANARTGVNKPELLPKEFTTVIDVAGFLSSGQENRLRQEIEDLEKDTGYKLRVLAQNYPDTPGLAIKDFWQVDERTIVFVADPTFGNIINFNIGPLVDLDVPRSFWSQVSGKYGNMFYWKEKVGTLVRESPYRKYVINENETLTRHATANSYVGETTVHQFCSFLTDLQVNYKNVERRAGRNNGEDASIEAAVTAISRCLRNPTGTNNCSEVL